MHAAVSGSININVDAMALHVLGILEPLLYCSMRAYRYLPEVIAYSWQASVAKPSASEHMAAVILGGGSLSG